MTGIYFEIWLDFLEKSDFKALFKAAKKPVIAVCRSQAEKGSFFGFEAERVALLQKAAESGASYIDIGAQTAPSFIRRIVETCRKNSAVLIISSHIWDKTPPLSELLALDARLRKMGADIVKIAVFVRKWADNATLFELTRRLAVQKKRAIVIGMGERGKISRIGCPLLGSYLTYAALDKSSKTAPGQLMLDDLRLHAI